MVTLSFPCLKILVAITGASGALYAQRLLDNLDPREHEIHVVMSHYAQQVVAGELPDGLKLPAGVKSHGLKSMNAPFASGSNPPDAMVVIPCTMGTMGRIAHGYSEDVLQRAADVVLKEKKKLILVPRETPLNLVHVKNMELLLLAGATLIPGKPQFLFRRKNNCGTGGHRRRPRARPHRPAEPDRAALGGGKRVNEKTPNIQYPTSNAQGFGSRVLGV